MNCRGIVFVWKAALMIETVRRLALKEYRHRVATSNNLSMSDVVVVRRTDALKDIRFPPMLFISRPAKVVPTLAPHAQRAGLNILPFYFAVFPDHTVKDAPKLTMAFYKDGQYLGSGRKPPLPAARNGPEEIPI